MARTGLDCQPTVLFRDEREDEAPSSLRFEEVAVPLFESLHSFARWLAPNLSDAEDLVQETYLKAQRSFSSFQPGTNLRAWMFRILKNTFLSSRSTLDFRMTDTTLLAEDIAVSPSSATPETLLITRYRDETTWRAILKLPVVFREVILLCDVEDVSYREIAERLSIPIGTVMSRLARGRRMVRESLLEHRAPKGDGVRRGVRGKRSAAPNQGWNPGRHEGRSRRSKRNRKHQPLPHRVPSSRTLGEQGKSRIPQGGTKCGAVALAGCAPTRL
jgi:RNA polymerase sigma-70 factor, ECF subfamily